MPNEEFMEKALSALGLSYTTMTPYWRKIATRVATALKSADASGYARGRAEAVEECCNAVPTTWLDPLLSGSRQ